MKKRKYESPQTDVASFENMQIICVSTTEMPVDESYNFETKEQKTFDLDLWTEQ